MTLRVQIPNYYYTSPRTSRTIIWCVLPSRGRVALRGVVRQVLIIRPSPANVHSTTRFMSALLQRYEVRIVRSDASRVEHVSSIAKGPFLRCQSSQLHQHGYQRDGNLGWPSFVTLQFVYQPLHSLPTLYLFPASLSLHAPSRHLPDA